jgi:hypothetical protein
LAKGGVTERVNSKGGKIEEQAIGMWRIVWAFEIDGGERKRLKRFLVARRNNPGLVAFNLKMAG